jgi:ADP-heptose:LPS heptosyltransferase
MTAPRRILVIQLRALGDVLLCTPALRQLRRAFPDARIDFLTTGVGRLVLDGNPRVDTVRLYRAGWGEGWRRFREIRAAGYGAVVDFNGINRSAIVTRLSGAPVRVGLHARGTRTLAYTRSAGKEKGGAYSAWRKVNALRTLGIPVDDLDLDLELFPGAEDHAWAEEEWRRLGLPRDTPVVAISGVSKIERKRWPAERWARVADAVADGGFAVLLTHGPGEEAQVERIVEAARHPLFRGHRPTTVRQLGALYARCRLWIGNDGGPRHIAVAMGIPTLAVARAGVGAAFTDTRPDSPHRFLEAPRIPDTGVRAIQALAADTVVEAAVAFAREHTPGARGGTRGYGE